MSTTARLHTVGQQACEEQFLQAVIGARERHDDNDMEVRTELSPTEDHEKLVDRVFPAAVRSPGAIFFCGVDHQSGAAQICIRTAIVLAQRTAGAVCIIDADIFRPSLHNYFGFENRWGLSDALCEKRPIVKFLRRDPITQVSVLAAGSGCGASARDASEHLRSRMAELRNAFPHILIYGPAVNLHSDAILLAQLCDGVILVIESGTTRRDTARMAKESLAAASARLLGAVFSNYTSPIPEPLYRKLR